MQLKGSCHCGAVKFEVKSYAPAPYMRCYCSICRKTAGGGGYAINLGASAKSLKVRGRKNVTKFRARIDGKRSPAERSFCSKCGTALWVWDPRWPELLHPFASAIDSKLPTAPEHVHILLDSKADWVPVDAKPKDRKFDEYPDQSLEEWHRTHGLLKKA
ncbi:MAG TPA: GFA family protein [Dongiaceae bacterium]